MNAATEMQTPLSGATLYEQFPPRFYQVFWARWRSPRRSRSRRARVEAQPGAQGCSAALRHVEPRRLRPPRFRGCLNIAGKWKGSPGSVRMMNCGVITTQTPKPRPFQRAFPRCRGRERLWHPGVLAAAGMELTPAGRSESFMCRHHAPH